ncbi:ATP-binding protein [Phenylobacterium sp.]|uniref:ATP-binding protein n=1 Tax=Phenylobacterium sp. TaxID=1871053 RepID=UPI003564AA34
MYELDDASLKVLHWRVAGLPARMGQTLLIGILLWIQIRSPLALLWLGGAILTALVDTVLSRRALERLDDRRLAAINSLSRLMSAVAFSSVCLVMLSDHSGFGLSAAIVVGCAINLNNAVMTRGARRYFGSLVLPSSVALVLLPCAAWLTDHPLSLLGALLLTVGTCAYTIFIVLLAQNLFRESEALRQALAAAEAASHAKSTFLAVTSHEIRTPLNGVLGMAQAMENDALSARQRGRLGVIRQSGEALLDILNDILDVAKIEAGKLELEAAPFDLEAVANSALGAFSGTAAEKGLVLGLDIDPAARGTYQGDAARVRQVLGNLISNAVKFTDAGEVRVIVAAETWGVRLSVRDTGPGVPDELAERLFEKFTQGDASTTRRYGGTGLGLAISRELCAAMGGAISVANGPNGGATFTVELPMARSEAAPASTSAEPPARLPAPAADAPALRVLAAEDNEVNQLVLRTLLEQIGIDPTIVDNGEDAVRSWETGSFDLILMDVQMPVMDGPAATRAIRAKEAASGLGRIPIVALTANVMSHQLHAYLEAGMDGFVAKPIAVTELYAAIARYPAPAPVETADDASAVAAA